MKNKLVYIACLLHYNDGALLRVRRHILHSNWPQEAHNLVQEKQYTCVHDYNTNANEISAVIGQANFFDNKKEENSTK